MLHSGVQEYPLVDINQLAHDIVQRFGTDVPVSELVRDYDQLAEFYDWKLQRSRIKALVLLPLLRGAELPWTGKDIFATASPAALASLFDPDGSDATVGHACQEASDARDLQGNAAVKAWIPANTSLKLVCPLGVPMSARLPSTDDVDELRDINKFQVFQVEIIHNGVVKHQKLALKLYDGRVRTPVRHFSNFIVDKASTSDYDVLVDGRTLACNEAAAYKKLKTLQGSLIPRSYGTYEFELPDGQGTCLGMLTQYIEHVSLGTHIYRILRNQTDESLARMVALAEIYDKAVLKLFELDVRPGHINSSSVKYDAVSGNPTFIGFSSSGCGFEPSERYKCRAIDVFVQAIEQVGYPDKKTESQIIKTLFPVFFPAHLLEE
ncbi:hypothetical protein P389DRAFT_211696 [Cystobasidium minutum MCA 4210]|uniref:uncharacterized protein n=1 Tax=Cystobasidium minutum MCA 4210 TaxID=1397322 RepID=UPI0034CF7E4F|eukprot:jgi/Rhomi1/211696/estExt_Genemark1.C_5_t10237